MPPRAVFSIVTVMSHCEPERKCRCTAEKQTFNVLHSSLAKQLCASVFLPFSMIFLYSSHQLWSITRVDVIHGTMAPLWSPLVPVYQMQ